MARQPTAREIAEAEALFAVDALRKALRRATRTPGSAKLR